MTRTCYLIALAFAGGALAQMFVINDLSAAGDMLIICLLWIIIAGQPRTP
jgi:hypothetical protein